MIQGLLLILLVIFSGCARPDYISDDEWSKLIPPSGPCSTVFPTTKACGEWNWNTPVDSSSYANASLTISPSNFFDEVSVVLWMPSMGHGSSPVTVQKQSDGKYLITQIFFIMPGDWEVRLYLKKSGQVVDQYFIPLMVP